MADQYALERERIAGLIAVDQRVYDVNGDEIGPVAAYDTAAGWVKVERGLVKPTEFYIPFSAIADINTPFGAIADINQWQIVLALSSDTLQRDFTPPPPRTTVITRVADGVNAAGETTAMTSEPSGYDGTPVVTACTDVETLQARLAAGMHAYAATGDTLRVYTVDGERVGSLTRYDARSGWMLVEHGMLGRHDVYVPVTVVGSVNLDAGEVYLTVGTIDLQRLQGTEPAHVVFVEAQATEEH
jgi:hypothetical protein